MKKSRFSVEQMVVILREVDQTSVPEISKKYKVSKQIICVWTRSCGER